MDSGTKWLVAIGILTAVATWGLAGATLWLARETKDMSNAAAESARLTAESLQRSLLIQELAALAPLAEGERQRQWNRASVIGFPDGQAQTRCKDIMRELGITRIQPDNEPVGQDPLT